MEFEGLYSNEVSINENYIFSKDNLYINFDKFESGESNICLITGLSGSGKSTLGKKLASEYKAEYVELDVFFGIGRINPKKIEGTIFEEYAKENEKDYNYMMENKPRSYEIPDELVINFMNWIISYCERNENTKYILEGVQVYSHGDPKLIKTKPIIFVNASVLKSMLQRHKRNKSRNVNFKDELKELPEMLKYYIDDEKNLKRFKEEILKEENIIESYEICEDCIDYYETYNDLPYFSPQEINKYKNIYTECNEDTEWQNTYNLIPTGLCQEEFYDVNRRRIETLNRLYFNYPNFDDVTKQRILNLGWNPEIPFSPENRKKATENTRFKMRSYYPIQIQDCTKIEFNDNEVIKESKNNNIIPIYLVFTWVGSTFGKAIRWRTGAQYTHALLSLDPNMDKMYSYNATNSVNKMITGGITIEDIKTENYATGNVVVYTVFITKDQFTKLKNNINNIINNAKNTKYAWLTIIGMLFNQSVDMGLDMVCSQFVDKMLKSIDIDLTHKNSSLVSPNDLYSTDSTVIYKIFEDKISNFKPQTIVRNTKQLKKMILSGEIKQHQVQESTNIISNIILKNGIDYTKLL